jgi:amino-acid N-acetyltransferase
VPITNADGTGITDAATLDLAVRAASRVSHLILEGLTQNNLKCAITNAVRSLPIGVIKGVDHQFTGKVDRIEKDTLDHLIAANIIPIIQPIGFNPDGNTLRINSDLVAVKVATTLNATKILFLSNQSGLMFDGVLRRDVSAEELRKVLADSPEQIPETSRSKAVHALRAIEAGIPRVQMVDGRVYDSLLNEIFSSDGVGTLIYGNDYQQIRPATRTDVRFIHSLIRGAIKREELLERTLELIEDHIDEFFVFEIDENIVACVTLRFYPDQPDTAELGSLYVMPFHHKRGIGRKMVEFAALRAKEKGVSQLVALSTQNPTFFTSTCRFEESDKSCLPAERLAAYESNGRNAKVMVRQLT